jgi:hypothetical protein
MHGDNEVTVLGHSAARKPGTVHLFLRTDRGPLTVRMTPADAQAIGTDLRVKAVHPPGERLCDASTHGSGERRPVEKPGGGIL